MRIVEPINKTVLKYKNFIWRTANDYKLPPLLDREDLVQAGYVGLYKAMQRYNPEKGCKFITYAAIYIKGYMIREMEAEGNLISKPIANKSAEYPKIQHFDSDQLDRIVPNQEEKDNIESVEQKLDYYSLKKLYDLFFNLISPQQKRALELYYFTFNDKGKRLSYREVADTMGISYERVRQLLNLGKKQLRNRFGKYLDVYV